MSLPARPKASAFDPGAALYAAGLPAATAMRILALRFCAGV